MSGIYRPKNLHPLFQSMIDILPPSGSEWPPASQKHWLDTMRLVIDLVLDHAPKQSFSDTALLSAQHRWQAS